VGRAENAEGLSLLARNDREARGACCSLDIETQKGKNGKMQSKKKCDNQTGA
jgi:hypothetical protein